MTSTMAARHIVLTGAMGAGKSTVGRAVAKELGRPFVDIDDAIEKAAAKTCAEIFAYDGAKAFRELERRTIEAEVFAADTAPSVFAFGGGATCDHEASTAAGDLTAFQRRVHEECITILLDIDPDDDAACEQLAARVGQGVQVDEAPGGRPLLALGPRTLLRARLPSYRRAFLRTNAMAPVDVVVAAVLAHVRAALKLSGDPSSDTAPLSVVSTSATYPVWLSHRGLDAAADALAAANRRPRRALLVTSTAILTHAERVRDSLESAGIECTQHLVTAGEEHKTAQTLEDMWDAAASAKLGRDDVIVAVGGGVIGDMAGFCAATFMRGMPVLQVPTTLLSMVDASVGGKVAIDRPQGKNLVGSFWSPVAVVVDPSVFSTLPWDETRAGMSEALKHAYLAGDEKLLEELSAFAVSPPPAGGSPAPALELLRRCIAVKRDVVEVDPFERGVRATLNLGHTFAHALERVAGFSTRHGDAVAVGLRAAAHLGLLMGVTPSSLVARIESDLENLGLDREASNYSADALVDAMDGDKKKEKGSLKLIVLTAFGRASIVDDPGPIARKQAWLAIGATA